jgi:hypothetical protein
MGTSLGVFGAGAIELPAVRHGHYAPFPAGIEPMNTHAF